VFINNDGESGILNKNQRLLSRESDGQTSRIQNCLVCPCPCQLSQIVLTRLIDTLEQVTCVFVEAGPALLNTVIKSCEQPSDSRRKLVCPFLEFLRQRRGPVVVATIIATCPSTCAVSSVTPGPSTRAASSVAASVAASVATRCTAGGS
jgi:hypothetical protein